MQVTLDYHIYKNIIEPCTLYDKDNKKIEVIKVNYDERRKQITLDFIGLEQKPYGRIIQ